MLGLMAATFLTGVAFQSLYSFGGAVCDTLCAMALVTHCDPYLAECRY